MYQYKYLCKLDYVKQILTLRNGQNQRFAFTQIFLSIFVKCLYVTLHAFKIKHV